MNPLSTGDPLRLGPYRLIGVLGAGGMGKVYLGRDNGGRPAAIKVLRPELAHDQGLARRFVREAEAAQAVRSKGVARVLGAQTEGGRPWMATEFLAGPTLDQAVEQHGPFDGPGLRALGATLARTLQDVHGAGLVHRDIKPPNIVLTSSGPRVIDFGIARPEHGLTLTSTGEVPVTPGYGPPEQVLGHRVGPAADVFALGAVLTYAATGRRAFEAGHVAAVQYEVVHGEPRLDGLDAELRAIIAPCLAKTPEGRPTPDQLGRACAPPPRADRAWKRGPLAEDIAERERDATRLSALPSSGENTWSTGAGAGSGPTRRKLLVGMAVGGTVVAAGGGTAAWWWLGGNGDDSGSWDAKPLSKYDAGAAPKPLWGPVQATDSKARPPVPVRDVLVVSAPGGGLRAYDVRDGKRRWQAKGTAPGVNVLAVPGETVETVLGVAPDGTLLALSAANGKQQWAAQDAGAASLLAADEEAAYISTSDGKLRAVSLSSHKVLWSVASPVRTSAGKPAKGAAAAGRLVVHGTDAKVAALDVSSGRTVWGPRRQGADSEALTPAIAGGTVFLGGRSLSALRLSDGKEKWSQKAEAGTGWGSPAVDGDVVYAVDGPNVRARTTGSGAGKWTLLLEAADGLPRAAAPVVQGHTAWLAMDENGEDGIVAVDTRNGQEAWPFTQGVGGAWQIAGAGNRAFLLHQGNLTAMPVL